MPAFEMVALLELLEIFAPMVLATESNETYSLPELFTETSFDFGATTAACFCVP
jgi:hypothetical protein